MPRGLQQSPPRGGESITDSLIAQRNLPCPAGKETTESISKALASLLTVRLDRENIHAISNLQGLREVRSLYLQQCCFKESSSKGRHLLLDSQGVCMSSLLNELTLQNQIETIENLSCLPNLRFLSLAGNRIRAVENLRDLKQLQFLDLSQNQIETLDSEELPGSLLILNLSGNRCTSQNGYRELVLRALPRLLKLDAHLIPSRSDPELAEDSASEEEADFPELTGPFCADKEFLVDLHQELAGRSQRRRQEALSEHQARLEELTERQRLMQPPGHVCPGSWEGRPAPSPAQEGAAGGRSPAPRLLEPHPKPKSRSQPKAGGSPRPGTSRAGGWNKCGSSASLKAPAGAKPAARAAKK